MKPSPSSPRASALPTRTNVIRRLAIIAPFIGLSMAALYFAPTILSPSQETSAEPNSFATKKASADQASQSGSTVLLTSATVSPKPSVAQSADDVSSLPPVTVEKVIVAEVKSGVRVVGTVNPLRTSTIGAAVDGRVLNYYVNQGDAVSAGDELVQLRTDTLALELLATETERDLAKQQLEELTNGARPEDIAEAEANALGAKAAMANAATQLKRTQELVLSRAATDASVEDARERAKFTEYSFNAAQAALDRVRSGPRIEQIRQAESRLQLQEHRISMIKDRIKKHTLISPFDGFVSAEYTEIGAWINSGDPVVQVIQLDSVEIEAQATADNATKLRPGDTVRVEFPEFPDQLMTGSVHRVVPIASSRARTFPVIVRMENEIIDDSPRLMAGMLARLDLPAGNRRSLPLVPKDALVLNSRERAVYVLEPDTKSPNRQAGQITGTVRKIAVELGVESANRIQVFGEIQADQLVIVEGNERLTPGVRVRVAKERKMEEETAPAG